MKQEKLQKTLESLAKSGITVAGDLVLEKKVEYEVNNVEKGGIGIQIINGSKELPLTNSDKEMKSVLEKLQEAKDENGKYIMYDYDQWHAVFRVLSQFRGYPTKPKDFETSMKNIGSDEFRIPCKYDNYRKVTLNKLPQNVALWKQYINSADQYSLKQLKVAMKLMELLNIE